jgi:uncharacterized membrane protein YuzA (DUF378 family)
MKHSHTLGLIAIILLVVGGINWGLIGLFRFDLIGMIFGEMTAISRLIYVLVGLAAVYRIAIWFQSRSK